MIEGNKHIDKMKLAIGGAGLILVFAIIVVLVWNNSNKKIYEINGNDITEDEFGYYAMTFLDAYAINSNKQLKADYSPTKSYEEYYKEEIIADMEEDYLMYACSKNEGIKLNKTDKKAIEEQVSDRVEQIGKNNMKKYGLDKELIKEILTRKYYGQKLLDTVEMDSDQEMTMYAHTYNLLFRTVKVDDDGFVVMDDKGNVVKETGEVKEQQLAKANEALDKLKAGADIEKLVEEYHIADCSGDMYGTKDSLDSEYAKTLYSLKEGDIGGVVETEYGYNVFKVISLEDEEYSKTMQEFDTEAGRNSSLEDIKDKWLKTAKNNDSKPIDKNWKKVKLKKYI